MDHIVELYENYRHKLADYIYYRFSYILSREDADDVVQEAFARALENYGTFQGKSKLSTWLYTIAENYTRDKYYRKPNTAHKNEHRLSQSERIDWQPTVDLRYDIDQSMTDLLQRHRDIIRLMLEDNYNYTEASQIMNCSRSAAKTLLYRARQNFMKSYDE